MQKWEPKHFICLLAILAVSGVVTVSILRDRIVNQQFRNVTVNGRGKVSYKPDIAKVQVGVQVDKKAKPAEALGELNNKIKAINDGLLKMGIKPENIETKNYSLAAQYDYKDNIQTVAGYNANQQLVVKVEFNGTNDLLNKIIAEASRLGANQINDVVFEASNIEDYKQQARVLALADANAKAKSLANVAGVSLGKITNWYENVISGDNNGLYDSAKGGMGGGGSAAPVISDSDNEVIIEIGLGFNLKD